MSAKKFLGKVLGFERDYNKLKCDYEDLVHKASIENELSNKRINQLYEDLKKAKSQPPGYYIVMYNNGDLSEKIFGDNVYINSNRLEIYNKSYRVCVVNAGHWKEFRFFEGT